MTTSPTDDGPETEVTDRPLGTKAILSQLLFPEAICAAAFENYEDWTCCPTQLAQVTKDHFENVCLRLDVCEQTVYGTNTWRQRGCTAKMIFEYCRMLGLGCTCLHGEKVLETMTGQQPVIFTIWENHAYFYEDKNIRRKLSKRQVCDLKQVRRDIPESKTPSFSEWQYFKEICVGHFWRFEEEMDDVRGQFLQSKRHPKCVLRSEHSIKTLIYTFSKSERESGQCIVHSVPHEYAEILQWLDALALDIPYRGQGLPGISYQVLLALLRKKQRYYLTGEEKCRLLEEYNHRCAECNGIGELQWDHITALSTSFGEQRFHPLCTTCHQNKTATEPRIR